MKSTKSLSVLLVIMVTTLALPAMAGTGASSSVFADIWLWLTEAIQGTLGAVVCGTMILVGIIAGIARQSLMAFAIGIGGGVGLYNTPTIVDGLFTATLANAPTATQVILTISNGL